MLLARAAECTLFKIKARDRAGEGVLLGKAESSVAYLSHGGTQTTLCARQEDENVAVDPEALQRLAKEPVILKMRWHVYGAVCSQSLYTATHYWLWG